jgi:hypothetical protein
MDSDGSNRQIVTKWPHYKLIRCCSNNRITVKHIFLPVRENEVELIIEDDCQAVKMLVALQLLLREEPLEGWVEAISKELLALASFPHTLIINTNSGIHQHQIGSPVRSRIRWGGADSPASNVVRANSLWLLNECLRELWFILNLGTYSILNEDGATCTVKRAVRKDSQQVFAAKLY